MNQIIIYNERTIEVDEEKITIGFDGSGIVREIAVWLSCVQGAFVFNDWVYLMPSSWAHNGPNEKLAEKCQSYVDDYIGKESI
jgi:hypothetical protein